MAIKVLIERWIAPGHEAAVLERLRELRRHALHQHGYLYGETWRSLDNPQVLLVVGAWGTREHWEAWLKQEFRQKMEAAINQMLTKPTMIRVFEEATTHPPSD